VLVGEGRVSFRDDADAALNASCPASVDSYATCYLLLARHARRDAYEGAVRKRPKLEVI
jgi:hypothetical protein